MTDGANQIHWGCHSWHPWGIHMLRVWSWASPTCQHTATSTACTSQYWGFTSHPEWAHEGARAEWGTPWNGSPIAPQAAGHEHVLLWLFGNSFIGLFWGKGPTGCRWLAPHHRIKIRPVTLHRVPKDSVCHRASKRSNMSLMGIVYRNTVCRSPWGVGWVLHCICDHHLSAGTVHRELVEFLELREGNHSMHEFTQEFNNLAQYGGHHVDSDAKKAGLYRKGLDVQLLTAWFRTWTCAAMTLLAPPLTNRAPWRVVKRLRKSRRGPCQDPPGVVLAVLHRSTAWFTCQPWDSRDDLRSPRATASNFSSSSVTLLSLYSSRGQLGHHSRSHQWGTRATIVRRLGTLIRNAACQGKPTHHIPQYKWQISRRASIEAQHCDLAVPTTPPWRRYLLAVLKPKRIIRKHTDANCSSFHLRVFLGLSNP
jgi:hypothetical protein